MTAVSYTAFVRNWLRLSSSGPREQELVSSAALCLFSAVLWVAEEARWPPMSDHAFINRVNWAGQGWVQLTIHYFSISYFFLEEGFRLAALPTYSPGNLNPYFWASMVTLTMSALALCLFWPLEHSGMWLWLLPASTILRKHHRLSAMCFAEEKCVWQAPVPCSSGKGEGEERFACCRLLGGSGEGGRGVRLCK